MKTNELNRVKDFKEVYEYIARKQKFSKDGLWGMIRILVSIMENGHCLVANETANSCMKGGLVDYLECVKNDELEGDVYDWYIMPNFYSSKLFKDSLKTVRAEVAAELSNARQEIKNIENRYSKLCG